MWFEWLFKYPREAYAQGELGLAGDFGVLWWGAAAVLLTLGIVFGRRAARFSMLRRATVHLLQIAAIAVLLTLIAEPVLQVTRLAPGVNTIAVLVDSSASMALPAGVDGASRMDVAKRLIGDEIATASGGSTVALFQFDDNLRQTDAVRDVRADGDRSRLLESIADLATHFDQGALAAVIVITDGAHNGGSLGWESLADTGIPVHAVGVGQENIPGDVELAELVLPSRASPNTQIAARLVIRHSASRDSAQEIRLRVLDGESVLAAESITLDASATTVSTDVVFPSGGPGLKEITVALAGPSEDPLPGNDRQSSLLEVDRYRYRVLYLEGEPRWEFKFIRRAAAEDDDIELVSWLRTTPRKTYRQGTSDPDELADGFPSSLEALYRYHMVIIGSLPATSLDDEEHEWLARFVADRGGGLLAMAGRHALDNGGWDVKPLAEALPVTIARPGTNSTYVRGNYAAHPTDAGTRSVLTDIGGSESRERSWATLPMLADYQTLGTPKAGATVILEAGGGVERRGADVVVRGSAAKPLLVTQPYGYGRTAVLATASTWRWRMRTPPDDTRHSLFWRHLIRHFAGAAQPRRRLSLVADGDSLDVRVALKNPRFEPLTDTAVSVQVTAPDGESYDVALPRIAGQNAYGETIPATTPGIYRVEVAGLAGHPAMSEGPRPDALAALARVGEANREQFGAALNEPLLRRIAQATGGGYWRADDLSGLVEALAFSSAGIHERQQLPLWNAPFLFLLLVLLKCTEWALRRYWGGI
ncbi:MAG: VWA domain-containing protein [Gammaproteobacteria bacterium]|nr:VWA domain-containing protein [Gammaproteobacteria bacterium]MYK47140.1 VWA domain-containing protein [Gammaproteobacteria bacterium]